MTEAHFVKGVLESHELSAAVRGEDLWSTRAGVPFVGAWPTVWVLDDSLEVEARAVIREYEANAPQVHETGTGWRCPKCGAELEPQFTACWACGAERPS